MVRVIVSESTGLESQLKLTQLDLCQKKMAWLQRRLTANNCHLLYCDVFNSVPLIGVHHATMTRFGEITSGVPRNQANVNLNCFIRFVIGLSGLLFRAQVLMTSYWYIAYSLLLTTENTKEKMVMVKWFWIYGRQACWSASNILKKIPSLSYSEWWAKSATLESWLEYYSSTISVILG